MTTLTVYFASSPRSFSSSSSSTNTTTTIIQPIRSIQNSIKPKLSPAPPSITLPIPASPTRTPPPSRTSSKRNKTFFERFNQTSPSTVISNPQSPTNQQQQQLSTDTSNPSLDPPPRLRRRFTFRRSLRHSVHNKGGDVDDGTSFDVDGSSSPRGVLNSHHSGSSTSPHNQQQYGTTNTTSTNKTTSSSGMHRRESFLYKCDSDNDISPKCISRNPSIGSEL